MTTVKSDQADRFVREPPRDTRAFLLLGPDDGLISERSRALARGIAARAGADANLQRIDGDALAADPDRYTSDLYGASLFGGVRILHVTGGGRDFASAVAALIREPDDDVYLIVEGGNLKKESSLRAMFQTARRSATIECYPDDPAASARLAEDMAREFGASLSTEARGALSVALGPDRLVNRTELEKLFLYARGRPTISAEDVEAVLSGGDESQLDAVIDDALTGRLKTGGASLAMLLASSSDVGAFPPRLIWRMFLLIGVGEAIAGGRSFQQALLETNARIPYFAQATVQKQVERWKPQTVRRLMPALAKYLARSRLNPRLASILLERFAWNLMSAAR